MTLTFECPKCKSRTESSEPIGLVMPRCQSGACTYAALLIVRFYVTRRGYYWQGPLQHGYCISRQYGFPFSTRPEAERWANALRAEVTEYVG